MVRESLQIQFEDDRTLVFGSWPAGGLFNFAYYYCCNQHKSHSINTKISMLELEVDIEKNPNSCDAFPQNLGRDDIPHLLWTVRHALSEFVPQNTENIHKWLFSSARNKKEVIVRKI